MRVTTGTVVSGKVVADELALADGTPVFIVSRDREDKPRLAQEERAELEAGIAEADRGDVISGDDFFEGLRRFD
jgi:hypothetical protein